MQCIMCKKNYHVTDKGWDEFMKNTGIGYECVKGNICPACAVKVFADKEEGVYITACDCCGQEFDIMRDIRVFRLEIVESYTTKEIVSSIF